MAIFIIISILWAPRPPHPSFTCEGKAEKTNQEGNALLEASSKRGDYSGSSEMLRKALLENAWGGEGAMYADHSCQLLPSAASLRECQLPSTSVSCCYFSRATCIVSNCCHFICTFLLKGFSEQIPLKKISICHLTICLNAFP